MDVAELVHMRNLVGDPEGYRETEHEGNLPVVEIVTLVRRHAGHRHTRQRHTGRTPRVVLAGPSTRFSGQHSERWRRGR